MDRAAVPVFWYAGGGFTTSSWYADTLPAWLAAWNARDPVGVEERGLVFADVAAPRTRGVVVDSLRRALADRVRQRDGVRQVYTPSRLATVADLDAMRWRRLLPDDLQWLIAVAIEPGWIWTSNPARTDDGGTNRVDVLLPTVIMAPGLAPLQTHRRVDLVDLAPTPAVLLGIIPTVPLDGRPLAEVVGDPRNQFMRLLLAALVLAPVALAAQEDAALRHARELLATRPIVDGHNDLPWEIRTNPISMMDVARYPLRTPAPGQTDFARLRVGGVGGQFWSVYVPGEFADSGYARVQLEQIDIARRLIASYPDQLELALTADDVERIRAAGKVASLLGMEGGHAIENSLGALRMFHALGARYMTLTHNVTLDWADAAMDTARHGGLTDFGRAVVWEMNRLGMIVDLSHVSPGTMSDALDATEAPAIFSHSSARALTDVPRNVPDSILARLPANGGVVMVTFVGSFISQPMADWGRTADSVGRAMAARGMPEEERRVAMRAWREANPRPSATVAQLADHIEHVRDVASIDNVGLGGDYDGTSELPVGMEDASGYPLLFAELIRRGWNDADLLKLAGGNILRVMREVERTSARLAAAPR